MNLGIESSTLNRSTVVDGIYVFISYARDDAAIAERVEGYLREKGIAVFRDKSDILAGQTWDNVIQQALNDANVMVLLMSKASMYGRKEVENEWKYFEKDDKLIIPLSLEPCDIHYRLVRHNYLDASRNLTSALDQLYGQLLQYFNPSDPHYIHKRRRVERQFATDEAPLHEISWSWADVRKTLKDTSERQSARLRKKYNPSLYLPRPRTSQHVDSFLISADPALILVGKSGVGKSNFVLHEIVSRFAEDADKAVVVLDGGTLENVDVIDFVADQICKGLGYSRRPLSGIALLKWIADNNDFRGKQVIVVIDAINESEYAIELIRSVNWWGNWLDTHLFSWLKFIVTTLPQAWRSIHAGAGRLNDNLYYRASQTDLNTLDQDRTVELTPFDIESDLPLVYEKYRAQTSIVTTFNDLSAEVRQLLCDPFALRIVMKTYNQRDYQFSIPRSISAHQIIEHYLEAIQFASKQPFRIIEQIVLPLMFVSGNYKNMVTPADMLNEAALTRFAPIFFEDALPAHAPDDLRQARLDFQNLVDTEILAVNRTGFVAVRFTYERFYNYFAANHLHNLLAVKDMAAQNRLYSEWFNNLANFPYLWGPLYILLLEEGRHGNVAILQAILQIDDARARNLLTNVLIELGNETSNSIARNIVTGLCHTTLDRAEPLTANDAPDGGLSTIIAQVAESLRLKPIITRGILSTNSYVSDAMTGVLINLWVSSSPADVSAAVDITWQVINSLKWRHPRQFGAGFRNVILACIAVMMMKYRDTNDWPALSNELRRVVIAALRKLPAIQWLIPKSFGTGNTAGIQQTILQAVINFVIYIAVRVGDEGQVLFDLRSARSFFELSSVERQAYRLFIDNVDAERSPHVLEEMQRVLFTRYDEKQLLGGYMLAMPFIGQIPGQASIVNQIIAQLFDQACKQLSPTLSRSSLTGSFMISMYLVVMRNALMTDELPSADDLRSFEDAIRRAEQQFWSTFKTTHSDLIWMDVASYYFIAKRLELPHNFELLRDIVKLRIARNDLESLPRFIHDLAFVGTHHMYQAPQLALDLLTVTLNALPTEVIKSLRSTLMDELVLLRTGDEYRVEVFLQQAPDLWLDSEAKRQIRTRKPRHKIGERIGVAGSWFTRDIMFDESPLMRQYLQWFFYTAIDSSSVREWFSRIASGILHEVFQGSSDPAALITQVRRDDPKTAKSAQAAHNA